MYHKGLALLVIGIILKLLNYCISSLTVRKQPVISTFERIKSSQDTLRLSTYESCDKIFCRIVND